MDPADPKEPEPLTDDPVLRTTSDEHRLRGWGTFAFSPDSKPKFPSKSDVPMAESLESVDLLTRVRVGRRNKIFSLINCFSYSSS